MNINHYRLKFYIVIQSFTISLIKIYLKSILGDHAVQEGVAQVHCGIEFLIIDPPPPTLRVRTDNKDQPNNKHAACLSEVTYKSRAKFELY